jgi:hypothetical protein
MERSSGYDKLEISTYTYAVRVPGIEKSKESRWRESTLGCDDKCHYVPAGGTPTYKGRCTYVHMNPRNPPLNRLNAQLPLD